MKSNPFKRFLKFLILLFLLIIIGAIALLITNYKGLGDIIKSKILPNHEVALDTLSEIEEVDPELMQKKDSSIFTFNTEYDPIKNLPLSDVDSLSNEINDTISSSPFFPIDTLSAEAISVDTITVKESDDPIIIIDDKAKTDFQVKEPEMIIGETYNNKEIDASSKILAIAGKNLLLNKSRDDQEAIILILAESDLFKSISIADLSKKVVFSSDQRKVGKVADLLDMQEISTDSMICNQNNTQCILPIYHTFGKLGYAIIHK